MRPLEIYIHIPFCVSKCKYCDFKSAPSCPKERSDYVESLCKKIRSYGDFAKAYRVVSIFVGGGTPSILDVGQMKDIFRSIKETFELSYEAEITVEMNPGTVHGKEAFEIYREAGINRLSIGLQSVADEELKRLGLHFSAIIPYSTSKAGSPDTKLDNLAVGVIQDYMIEAEKRMVAELVKDKRLGQDAYLLKDGSLEYKVMKSGREDLRTLQKIKHNYSWVIGVSKSFNPESCLDHTGKPNSNYIADLPVFHRTPVARYENREFLGDVQFGVWYIRLRDKRRTQTPFDGVVKVEKIMMDEEIENGIDSDVIDLISANIINERNPTCYGTDRRWANHLYPVFLTESYVKSKYISTEMFLHLF